MEISLLILCLAAFAAGFVDGIVGGGGLIQTPVGLLLLPQFPVATVIATLKIPAFTGTSFAAYQYLKKTQMKWKLLALMAAIALASAFAGSALLTYLPNDLMKPLLLVVLSLVALYTFLKKDFGQQTGKKHALGKEQLLAVAICLVVGFYDGFIGPGAGSFLVLGFIALLGFTFLEASAHAKMVNLATNLGSICLFLWKGKILWAIAIPMALSNAAGGWLGARLAIRKGNRFIRSFFLLIVVATLLRFAWDVLMK